MPFYIFVKTNDILKLTRVSPVDFFKQINSMLDIENTRLRSMPKCRHYLADSLAGTLFLIIVCHRGRGGHGENNICK